MKDKKYEEIDLKDILMVVWRKRVLFAIVAMTIIIAGAFVTLVLPQKEYKSEAIIEVTGTETSLNIGTSSDQSIQNMLNEIMKPLDISFQSYVDYLLEDEVLEDTIKEINLEDKYNPETLKSKLNISSDEETQTIQLGFISSDPKEPSKILESLINNFVEYINGKVKTSSEEILTTLREQTEIEKQKYENTFETYESFINENKSVDEYEIEKQAMVKQIVDFKRDLKNLEIKEEGIKAAIEENDSFTSDSGESILQTNDGNSVYIGDAKNALNLNLAEVKEMRKATAKTITALEEEIKQINLGYKRAEIEAISINQKLDTSKESYESFSKTYETIQTISSFDKGQLSIIKSVEPKEAKRVQSSGKIEMLMIIVIGVVFGIISTFIKEFLDFRKKRKTK